MEKKQKSIKKPSVRKKTARAPRKSEVAYVPRLPEYEKDMSHLMTPENRRPEIEELIRKMAGDKVVDRKLK